MRRAFLVVAFLLASWFAPVGRSESATEHSQFEGTWLGHVVAPNASTDIAFTFTRRPQGLMVAFSMPAMAVFDAALGPARFEGDTFVLPSLDTRLALRDGKLTGTFAIPHLPMELTRVPHLPPKPAPSHFPPGPAPVWRVALDGKVWASPVVEDGMIYVGTTQGRFTARAVRDGSEVWTWSGPRPLYGAALVTTDRVWFVDSAFDLVCLDRAKGELRWRRPLFNPRPPETRQPENETYNHRTPQPVLLDGSLYVGSADGSVYAIEPRDGSVQWRHETKTPIHATIGVSNGLLLVGGLDGTVMMLNHQTHQEVVRTRLNRAVVSAPVAGAGVIVTGCRDYMLYGLRASDLAPVWRHSYWFSWVESAPAYVDGTMYIGGSDYARILAFKPTTGAVEWETNIHGLTWGTPLVTADAVYAGTHAQGDALIPHEAGIVALDRTTGEIRWRIAIPPVPGADRTGVVGSLALEGDRLIAATYDGGLAAYPLAGARR